MHPMILIQLRMKRQRHLLPIPNRHNPILYYSQYLNSIRNIRHIRRADKRHRNLPNSFKLCFRVKTPQLPSISIPLHRHRNRLKMHHRIPLQRIRQKNHPRTGSQNRKPILNLLPDRIKHPYFRRREEPARHKTGSDPPPCEAPHRKPQALPVSARAR